MKMLAVLAVCAVTMTGCASAGMDEVMGRTPGTPVTQPATERPIDCDLIFPGGGADRR